MSEKVGSNNPRQEAMDVVLAILGDASLTPGEMAHLLSVDDDGKPYFESDPRAQKILAVKINAGVSGNDPLDRAIMSAEGPRSFSAIVAAKRAEFISYREAITKLAEYSGDSLAAVAAALRLDGFYTNHMAYLSGPAQVVKIARRSNDLSALLDQTVESGEIRTAMVEWGDPVPAEEADPDLCGWMRDDFIANLRASDLPYPETLNTPDADEVRKPAAALDWTGLYVSRARVSLPATDVELANKLRSAETERDALRSKVEEQSATIDNLTEMLGAEKREIQRLTLQVPPLSDYLIPVVAAVQREFWIEWDESKPRPKAEVIAAWAKTNFPRIVTSDAIANAVDKVACPVSRNLSARKQP